MGPRLALQLIHEAALCRTGLRHRRALNQRIFELANGLPFLASDMAVHELLGARSVADSLHFQVALGKIRRASGHFRGRLLAVDPHRVRSFSKRHMRLHRHDESGTAYQDRSDFFRARRRHRPTHLFHHGHLGAHGRSRSRGTAEVGQ